MNFLKTVTLSLGTALLVATPMLSQASTNLVANGSFESVPFALSGNDGSYCYVNGSTYGCAGQLTGWNAFAPVMTSTSGAWGATPDTPSDLMQIGLQNTSSFSQTIMLASAGTYTLSWSDSGRASYGNENYQVSFGGAVVDSLGTLSGQAWGSHSITVSSAAGGQVLSFEGLNTLGDSTAFVDNVSLTAAVPEPSSWALMVGGLASLGFMARRRKS